MFSIWGVTHSEPFFVQTGPKKTIFKRFYQHFFRTTRLQHKLLILIESHYIFHGKLAKKRKVVVVCGTTFVNLGQIWYNIVKKKKKNWYFNGVFNILHELYIYKHEEVFIEISECKVKAKLARNTIFTGNYDETFAHFGSKIAKSHFF